MAGAVGGIESDRLLTASVVWQLQIDYIAAPGRPLLCCCWRTNALPLLALRITKQRGLVGVEYISGAVRRQHQDRHHVAVSPSPVKTHRPSIGREKARREASRCG